MNADELEAILVEALELIIARLREGVVSDVQRELVQEEAEVLQSVSKCRHQRPTDGFTAKRKAVQSIATLDARRTTRTLDHVASLADEEIDEFRETVLRVQDLAKDCDLDIYRAALVRVLAKQRADEFRREILALRRVIRRMDGKGRAGG